MVIEFKDIPADPESGKFDVKLQILDPSDGGRHQITSSDAATGDRTSAAPNAHQRPRARRQSSFIGAVIPEHATTFMETLMHILKGNIGSGVFAMGDAFKNGGLILAPVLTLLMGVICVHSQHMLLDCAQRLKTKHGQLENPDFAETVEMCFQSGPERTRRWAPTCKFLVNLFLCITQMGFCSIYFVFISSSIKQIFDFYGYPMSVQLHMLAILVPVLLPCLLTQLKVLAICSTVANVCMASGIGVVFFYALQDIPSPRERHYVGELHDLPLFFGTAIFAFEGIALVLPLKNAMKKIEDFDKPLGVLNLGMGIVTMLFISFGFFGYLKWGDETAGSLTLNLPKGEILGIVVKIVVSVGMLLTFPLQFFVPVQIMLPSVSKRFEYLKRPVLVEMVFRTALVLLIFSIAELVPNLSLFISLIGSVCASALALGFPPIIQTISQGTGNWLWMAKNCAIMLIAFVGFLTGTYESLYKMIKEFSS